MVIFRHLYSGLSSKAQHLLQLIFLSLLWPCFWLLCAISFIFSLSLEQSSFLASCCPLRYSCDWKLLSQILGHIQELNYWWHNFHISNICVSRWLRCTKLFHIYFISIILLLLNYRQIGHGQKLSYRCFEKSGCNLSFSWFQKSKHSCGPISLIYLDPKVRNAWSLSNLNPNPHNPTYKS